MHTTLNNELLSNRKIWILKDSKQQENQSSHIKLLESVTLFYWQFSNILKREEGYLVSFKQLVITLLGLGSFVKTAPATIWYASMIIFFYCITPFVLYKIESKLVISLGILVSFYFLACINFYKWKYITIDSRFFEHYFIYFSTLLISYYYRRKLLSLIFNNKF